jgi:hypothetical protein
MTTPGRGSSGDAGCPGDGYLSLSSHRGSNAQTSVIEDRALRIRRDGSLSKAIRSSSLTEALVEANLQQYDHSDTENREEIRRALKRQNITISQLNLSDLELYGRESELSLLLSALEEISPACGGSPRPVIVTIQGALARVVPESL